MDEAPEGRKEARDPGERRAQDEYISSLLRAPPHVVLSLCLASDPCFVFLFYPVLSSTNVLRTSRFLRILSMSRIIHDQCRFLSQTHGCVRSQVQLYSGTRDDNVQWKQGDVIDYHEEKTINRSIFIVNYDYILRGS